MNNPTQIEAALAALTAHQTLLGDDATSAMVLTLQDRLLALEHAAQHPDAQPSAAAFAGQRKIVTILYADISGFTALAERADPETVRDSINACFDRLVPCVAEFGGTVDKFIGDAIMALFGAPTAHENDPERALRAALAMMTAIEQFNAEHGTDLGLHMGINTGLVIAGGIGARGWQQYSVMGDAVNVAARLEDLATRGEIFVGPDTYRATAPLFEFTAREPIALKGKAQPLPIYQLHGLKARPERVRGIAGLDTPLIGRAAELAELRACVATLAQGVGHAVYLVGEAGLGKSRLLAELRAELEQSPSPVGLMPLWMESQAVAYQSTRPYALFQQLFRQMSGLEQTVDPQQIHAQIDLMLAQLTADGPARFYPTRTRRVLDMLLGLSDDPEQAQLVGETFQRELFTVVETILRARVAAGPLVLALDDLHWADQASVELLRRVIPLVEGGPLLVIGALRPERQSPAWQLVAPDDQRAPHHGHLLEIAPLSLAESDTLINSLLSVADLPADLRERIMQRAEGNPFFVEEIIRDLIDRGVLVRDHQTRRWLATDACATIVIPENLHALLVTRIDRLSDAARHTLQLAALIGRVFEQPLLAQVVEPDYPLDAQLDALERSDLIVREPDALVQRYRFRHALTQEAAASSMLLRQRRAAHARIGAALERLAPDRADELASTLAQHFAEAGDQLKALAYHRRAGDLAYRLYAHDEAIRHYRQALDLAERLSDGPDAVQPDQLIHLFTRLGRSLELSAQFGAALDLYEAMIARSRALPDRQLELAALLSAATIRITPTRVRDVTLGHTLAQSALELACALGDPAAEARALWNLQLATSFAGQPAQSIAYGEASLAIARAHGLREQLAYTLNDLGLTYLIVRGPAAAWAVLREAEQLWRELDNMPLLADTLGNLSLVAQLVGDLPQVRRVLDESLRICQSIGNLWGEAYSLNRLTQLELEAGDFQAAIDSARAAIQVGAQSGLSFAAAVSRLELGWVLAHLGRLDQGLVEVQLAAAHVAELQPQTQPWPLAIQARLLIRAGQLAAADALLAQAMAIGDASSFVNFSTFLLPIALAELAIARQQYQRALYELEPLLQRVRQSGVQQFVADMRYLMGGAQAGLRRWDAARESMRAAAELSRAIGARRTLWPALLAWAELEAAHGDPQLAAELRQEARATLAAISGLLHDAELRAAFLAMPDVQRALGQAQTPAGLLFP